MRIKAEIRAYDTKKDELFKAFEPEMSKKDRSGFEIKKEKDHLLFNVEAKDSVALRATLNSITKLMTVFEKTNEVVK